MVAGASCVRILTCVARVNNLFLRMRIASASHIGEEAAASRYCIALCRNGLKRWYSAITGLSATGICIEYE